MKKIFLLVLAAVVVQISFANNASSLPVAKPHPSDSLNRALPKDKPFTYTEKKKPHYRKVVFILI